MSDMKNPYKPGTVEYLDWATEQHTRATSPKTKEVKKVQKKPMAKKKDKLSEAFSEAEKRKKKYSGGLAGMFGL
jgi:hypothetical protein